MQTESNPSDMHTPERSHQTEPVSPDDTSDTCTPPLGSPVVDGTQPYRVCQRPVLLTKEQLAEILVISTRKLDRLIAASKVPRPFYVGCSARWKLDTIASYLDQEEARQR